MKNVSFLLLCIYILGSVSFPTIAKTHNDKTIEGYVSIGKIDDSLLLELLQSQKQKKIHVLSKTRQSKAVLLDGKYLTPQKIKADPIVKKAIQTSVPIVIAKPTKEEVRAITGAAVQANSIVIIPRKQGEEFEINLIPENLFIFGNSDPRYHVCSNGFGDGLGVPPELIGNWGNSRIPNVVKIINNAQQRNDDEVGDFADNAISCHKRWTVKPLTPSIWGSQGQMMDIGFQYDLYYVSTPVPSRKYLTVKTVGRGASPGNLRADNPFHRGYYQNAVTVKVTHSDEEWSGNELECVDLAPRTDNNSGQVNVTTGLQFQFGFSTGLDPTSNTPTGPFYSPQYSYQRSRLKQFNDFTVNQENHSDGVQWTYWLSGADGAVLRRKHQANDLISKSRMIRELPELAKGSWLKPYLEVVYSADGEETGKQKMVTTVEQSLQDVKTFGLFKREHNILGILPQEITIDFSQVDAQCN